MSYDCHVSRREFLRRAVAAGTAIPFGGCALNVDRPERVEAPRRKIPLSERLNIAVIGPAGRGAANARDVSSENIVALCDVDSHRLASAAERYPNAQTFKDYRQAIEVKGLHAVVVSTPDHMHAFPAVYAMRAGLDVYCEKPLAHSVWEVRVMRETAKEYGAVTQMGTQVHARSNYRRVVEIVRSGVIGQIRRVHVWLGGKPNLNSGVEGNPKKFQRVAEAKPPSHIDYDRWIGPAPMRPFDYSHVHFNWRYWWDFGNGMLGDFGCHYMDLPHWALDLRAPLTVESSGEKVLEGDNGVPTNMRVEYHYPARGDLAPVHLTWYHGDWRPEGAEVYEKNSAVLFEGENGRLLADYSSKQLFMDKELQGDAPAIDPIPESVGHHREWIEAVKTRGTTTCNFDYSGALTETVLLGNVSYRVGGKKLEWDDKTLRVKNVPEAAPFVRREYRKGWELDTKRFVRV